jgi:signal transduction histidine kinase
MKSAHSEDGFAFLRNDHAHDEIARRPRRLLLEARIVILYLVMASIWIVESDLILNKNVSDQAQTGVIQSLKGLNFVLTTAILLFFVLRGAYGGWRSAEARRLADIERARGIYRCLSSKIQSLREEERTRIAREIHDELGQLLTGIKMELRLIENNLSNREDRTLNPVIDLLVDTAEMVDTTIDSVQRISAGLRPCALDDLGLPCALSQEAERFAKRTGITCAIDIKEPETPMSPEVETAVFRIFQESLTNIARHAHASKVEADYAETKGVLRLSVRDNGDGIDPSVLDDPDSLGLIGMLERAENVGGSVSFIRHPDEGTEVILTVPLAGKSSGEGLAA